MSFAPRDGRPAELHCANNLLLSQLNIESGEGLVLIDCSHCILVNLDLSNTPDLQTLNCSDNCLTKLDISSLEQLTVLHCQSNYITDLAALEEWLAAEDHEGTLGPQDDPEPDSPAAKLFDDVDALAWYVKDGYLDYVVTNGIMTGYTDTEGNPTGLFGPDDPLTRAQAATVIYRLLDEPALEGADGDLTTGTPMLVPGGNATRCQMVKIITRTAGYMFAW